MTDVAWTEYTRFVVALVAVLDPLAAIPIFLGLTASQNAGERRRTAFVTSVAVAAVLVTAALVGESVLTAFGTSLAAFRVGGGLVLAAIAVEFIVNGLRLMLPVLTG